MRMIIFAAGAAIFAAPAAAQKASEECIAAAARMTQFLVEEAEGTRHAAQIEKSFADHGGRDQAVAEMAKGFTEDQCATMLVLPDSSMRAMAIANLPERLGN